MTPAELLESVRGWLWTLSYRAARRHGLDAEDAFQAAAVRVMASAHTFDPAKGKATTWSFSVMRTVVQRLLAEKRKHARAVPVDAGVLAAQPDREADTEDAPYRDHLPAALGALSPRERVIVEQHHGIGATEDTMAEIGERLGVSRQRIFQIHTRAIAKLRTALLALAHPPALTA